VIITGNGQDLKRAASPLKKTIPVKVMALPGWETTF